MFGMDDQIEALKVLGLHQNHTSHKPKFLHQL